MIPIDSRRSDVARPDGVHRATTRDADRAQAGHHGDGHDAHGVAADDLVERMLTAVPVAAGCHRDALRECIEAIRGCAVAAAMCADACLAEEMVEELAGCIRTLISTADVCEVTVRVLSRPADPDRDLTWALLSACWAACRRAREVCEELLSIHDHCRLCAQACRAAELACHALLAATDRPAGSPTSSPAEQPLLERSR